MEIVARDASLATNGPGRKTETLVQKSGDRY